MPISKDEWLRFEQTDISALITCINLAEARSHFVQAFTEIVSREAKVSLKEKEFIFNVNQRLLKAAQEASRAAPPLPAKRFG